MNIAKKEKKMKKLMVMGLAAVFAMTSMVSAQNLLSNGDFELGYNDPGDLTQPNELNPTDWTEDHSGGWSNREINGQMPDGHSYAIGNAGGWGATVYQDVAGTAGNFYQLRADSLIDAWWLSYSYLGIDFLDAGGNVLAGSSESPHVDPGGYDVGTTLTRYSLTLLAPAGTVDVRAKLGGYGEGGTVRYDNAVLEVVPEPATLGLLGLSGLALWIVRRRG